MGYVARVLASNPKQIAKLELKRWLKKQSFNQLHLESFVKALGQPDWSSATNILDQAYGGDQSWATQVPSSLLAEMASKRIADQDELSRLLTILSYRIAEEDDVITTSQLLNGALQASLSFGNLVVCGEIINYAIRFATEIARVEIEKQSSVTLASNPRKATTRTHDSPDRTLALRPLLSVIAGLMSKIATRNRAPTFGFLGQILRALVNLCGSLESVLNRLSKPNRHLVCRAMITSMFSPDGHSIKPHELDEILKQKLPAPTLRLAMVAMIQVGDRDRATAIESLVRRIRSRQEICDSKLELDLAFHEVRRCKFRAYTSSERLHQRFLSHLPSIETQPCGVSIETYTAYMSALLRHHLPKMALEVWERMMRKGVAPDTAAIQVAMSMYIDLCRPSEAVQLFHHFASQSSSSFASPAPCQSNDGTTINLRTLATYARALDISGRYLEVYELWKNLKRDWGLEHDTRFFATLLSSARKITRRYQTPVSNAMFRLADPDPHSQNAVDEDYYWDGEPAGQVAMRLFWTILYENWAALSETVRAPPLSMSLWSSSATTHVRLLDKLCGLNPTPNVSISQPQSTWRNPQSEMAATIIPSLRYKTRWSAIIPNRSSFKDMIELLGFYDQVELIPLLLSWMKSIEVKPNQELLTKAYYWIYKSSPITSPVHHRLTGLDQFVQDWIDDIKGYDDGQQDDEEAIHVEAEDLVDSEHVIRCNMTSKQLVVPTEEMIQAHHLQRVKWSNRIYFSKAVVSS